MEYNPQFTGFESVPESDLFELRDLPDTRDFDDQHFLVDSSNGSISSNVDSGTDVDNEHSYADANPSNSFSSNQVVNHLNSLGMYQLLSTSNMNNMPVIIVNIPSTASVQNAQQQYNVNMNQLQQDGEHSPAYKKRKSVVEENDSDLMSLSHQMDLLRRNSLPVLHQLNHQQHPFEHQIAPSVSVDDLLSPSKFLKQEMDLLGEFGSDIINPDELQSQEGVPDSPAFDFANFLVPTTPAKIPVQYQQNTISEITHRPHQPQPQLQQPQLQQPQIHNTKRNPHMLSINTAPTLLDVPKRIRKKKSTATPSSASSASETPQSSPGTPNSAVTPTSAGPDGRKLVCLGKRPRKNKKTQPEDQFLMKFTMRRNK
ncbi:protease HtpX [Acrasis kona]|uniref:Protease HtpX n=1 Tax=Acrasis kona TaxID=1008807 RepID=A0AAW2YTK7_9EUKA